MEVLNNLIDFFTYLLQTGGLIYGFLIIILESIIPALPLGVFIALNINAYGLIIGIVTSWIATCIGCYISYSFFKFLSKNLVENRIKKNKLKKIMKKMKEISFSNLVVLIALPFTPAFLINISCGIVEMSKKKFMSAILIGKVCTVIFWGCIGKSLLESLTDIKTIITVSIFIAIAYFFSKLVSKKMNIE